MRLTHEQLDFYMENGYVIIREVFSSSESRDLSLAIEKLVTEVKQFKSQGLEDQFEELRGSQIVLSVRPDAQGIAIKRLVWAAASSPFLLEKGRDLKLLQMVSQILDSTQADHLINQVHFKDPGDGVSFPWHQDEQNRRSFDSEWEDCGNNGSYVVAITAIDQCTVENGPLLVIPGSHKYGYLNFGTFLKTEDLQYLFMDSKKVNVADIQMQLFMEPGDTVLMHPRLIHCSWPNTSNQSRRVLINGFSSPGANHRQYPGVGSAKRISLIDGKEIALDIDKGFSVSVKALIAMNTPVQHPPPTTALKDEMTSTSHSGL